MKRALMFVVGGLLFLLGVWGGAYALEVFGRDDWRSFPAFVTAVMVCVVGYLTAFAGFML